MNMLSSSEANKLFASACSTVFAHRSMLPHRVFNSGFTDYRWLEFDLVFTNEFWGLLNECTRTCGAHTMYVASTDPDNEINYGYSGVVAFSPGDTYSDYRR